MKEIWKPIRNYEGIYEISNTGKVKRLSYIHHTLKNTYKVEEHILNTKVYSNRGYQIITLSKNSKLKTHLIHRLVAEAFIPNPDNLPEVNHIDENKTNNCVNNLEWCSRSYNNNYGTRNNKMAKKLSKPVICVETGTTYSGIHEAGRQTGIDYRNIHACCSGRCKTTGGYHWRYA